MAFPKVSGWTERIWRNANAPDVARGNVPKAYPHYAFGKQIASAGVETLIRETGMPATLTVPLGLQLSIVSTSASDTGQVKIKYLNGGLVEVTETVTLTGTTPVLTSATDIRAVNDAYNLDGAVTGTVSFSGGGVVHALIPAGDLQFHAGIQRVPQGKRLMITSMYAGSASGSSAAKTIISLKTSFINGDSFAEQGYLHSVGAVAIQDNSTSLANFGVFPIPAGEWYGFSAKSDKDAEVTAGLFGWMEDE